MARRCSKKNDKGTILLYVPFVTVLVFVLAGPAPLFIAWIIAEAVAVFHSTRDAKAFQEFDLSPEERRDLGVAAATCERLRDRVSTLYEEDSHLQTRQDGCFSERSKHGKELNAKFDQSEPRLADTEARFAALAGRPLKLFEQWKTIRGYCWALRGALIGFIFVCGLLLFFPNETLIKFGNVLNVLDQTGPFGAPNFLLDVPHFWGASLIGLLAALAIGWLSYRKGLSTAEYALEGDIGEIDYLRKFANGELEMPDRPPTFSIPAIFEKAILAEFSDEELIGFLVELGHARESATSVKVVDEDGNVEVEKMGTQY